MVIERIKMNKMLMIGPVILLVVIGGWFLLGKQKPSTSSNTTVYTPPVTTTPPPAGGSTTTVSANSVIIRDMAFLPASVTVKVGTTVTWTNQDPYVHTVTGDGTNAPKGFDSGNLSTGKSYSFTFTTPGTFTYHCKIHPQLIGSVIVQ